MNVEIKRYSGNPIVTKEDITPTFNNFKVDGVLNAGVALYNGETIMLMRVTESVVSNTPETVCVPLLEENNTDEWKVRVQSFDTARDRQIYNFSDPRLIYRIDENGETRIKYLTSLSHLRLARSKDGFNFKVDSKPFIFPEGKYEAWGVEDPRITQIDGYYYINYTAVSEFGAATALARTADFVSYEKLGIIFPPENKDVCIFPEKINGKYYTYHRPVPNAIGTPDIWVASSENLVHWGEHRRLFGTSENGWENGRTGGGAPSIKTEKGWLHIYHGADRQNRYCLGAFLADLDDPSVILAKTSEPILQPEADYEMFGFFNHVVFSCGAVLWGETLRIYYGAADERMAVAEVALADLYRAMGV